MTQALSNLNISPWQFLGVVVLTQVLLRSKADSIVGTRLGYLIDELSTGAKNAIYDFPVIALTGGFTYIVHQFIPPSAAHLTLSTLSGAEGSLKVAAFVSGVFALKAALSTYFQATFNDKVKAKFQLTHERHPRSGEEHRTHADLIREGLICNFLPLAIGTFGAYYTSIPLKLAQTALYTASLIGVVKLLGKGIDYILADERVKVAVEATYSWLNLESSLTSTSTGTPKK